MDRLQCPERVHVAGRNDQSGLDKFETAHGFGRGRERTAAGRHGAQLPAGDERHHPHRFIGQMQAHHITATHTSRRQRQGKLARALRQLCVAALGAVGRDDEHRIGVVPHAPCEHVIRRLRCIDFGFGLCELRVHVHGGKSLRLGLTMQRCRHGSIWPLRTIDTVSIPYRVPEQRGPKEFNQFLHAI